MGILELSPALVRRSKIIKCNNGYTLQIYLVFKNERRLYGGASILLLDKNGAWHPFKNRILNECTFETFKSANLARFRVLSSFILDGAL